MTREKAIKIVKEFINSTCLHLVDQEALETLIPELRESEDERIRKELINFFTIENWHGDVPFNDKCGKKYLAWLEKQKEQKPSEWSEEDEKMRCNILNVLTSTLVYTIGSHRTSTYKYNNEIEWLKSLKPQWKPSEEQMEALLWCVAHLGGADHRVLGELYEHLKMLKKEE